MSLCNCKYLTRDLFIRLYFVFSVSYSYCSLVAWHYCVVCKTTKKTLHPPTHCHIIRSPTNCLKSISHCLDPSIISHCIINWAIAMVSSNTSRCTVRRQHYVVKIIMCAAINWKYRWPIVGINQWHWQRKTVSKSMVHKPAVVWLMLVQRKQRQEQQRRHPHRGQRRQQTIQIN